MRFPQMAFVGILCTHGISARLAMAYENDTYSQQCSEVDDPELADVIYEGCTFGENDQGWVWLWKSPLTLTSGAWKPKVERYLYEIKYNKNNFDFWIAFADGSQPIHLLQTWQMTADEVGDGIELKFETPLEGKPSPSLKVLSTRYPGRLGYIPSLHINGFGARPTEDTLRSWREDALTTAVELKYTLSMFLLAKSFEVSQNWQRQQMETVRDHIGDNLISPLLARCDLPFSSLVEEPPPVPPGSVTEPKPRRLKSPPDSCLAVLGADFSSLEYQMNAWQGLEDALFAGPEVAGQPNTEAIIAAYRDSLHRSMAIARDIFDIFRTVAGVFNEQMKEAQEKLVTEMRGVCDNSQTQLREHPSCTGQR